MSDLNDLRQVALSGDAQKEETAKPKVEKIDDGRLFGMTALERMFLSIGLFAITLVISMLLLIVTESIAL